MDPRSRRRSAGHSRTIRSPDSSKAPRIAHDTERIHTGRTEHHDQRALRGGRRWLVEHRVDNAMVREHGLNLMTDPP